MRDSHELWRGRLDGYVLGVLNDIESGGGLTFEKIAGIYRHFNSIAEVDEPFELMRCGNDEVVVYWPRDEWKVTFKLK